MNASQAFIAYLRVEASSAEERAKKLRATAAAIEANAHEARGRKKRRREGKPKKSPHIHTGYTLYVHENFEAIKKTHGANMPSKDILSIIARQWSEFEEEEKRAWQCRAEQLKGEHERIAHETDAMATFEPPSVEEWDNRKRPARKVPPKGMTSV